MRSRLYLAGSVAAALVFLTVAVWGQSAPNGQTPPGPGRHRAARLNLNLTDNQRAQMRALVQQHRAALAPQRQALGDLYGQLRAETLADTPDQAKIDQLRAQIVQAQSGLMTARLGLAQELAQVLTPEQRQQLRDSGVPFGRLGAFMRGWRMGRRSAPPGAPVP